MKKLISGEVICTILAIGVFILIFSFMDGWSSELSVRHGITIGSSFLTGAILITGTAFAFIAGAAVIACVSAAGAGAVVIAATTVSVGISFIAGAAVVACAVIVGNIAANIVKKQKLSKRKVYFSLIVEGVVIFGTIIAIAFP